MSTTATPPTTPLVRVVLVNPEIPPNTGNVIRQCAVAGASLHLVEPLAFDMSDARLRRAGLDYHEFTSVARHSSWTDLQEHPEFNAVRCFTFSTVNNGRYDRVDYAPGDWLVFGNEARGLPALVRESVPLENRVRLPMVPDRRSINLATSVGIAMYEAWRQMGFIGSVDADPVTP